MILSISLVALALGAIAWRDTIRERWLDLQTTDTLRDRASLRGGDPLVCYVLARRLVNAGDLSDASQVAAQAAASLPASESDGFARRVLLQAGYLQAQFGDATDAAVFLDRAERIRPGDAFIDLGRGILAMKRNDAASAVGLFRSATRRAPSMAEAWTRLGTATMQAGDAGAAIAPLRKAIELNAKSAASHADLAEGLARSGNFREAASEYAAATQLSRDDEATGYRAQLALAEANAARTDQEYRTAAALLEQQLESGPGDDDLRLVLAGLRARFCDFAAARRELEATLSHNPRNSDAWFNLATVCERIGDRGAASAARKVFDRMISLELACIDGRRQVILQPSDAARHLRLSHALRQAGRDREAYDELRRAAELRPNDPQIARTLAGATQYMQQIQGAAQPPPQALDLGHGQ